MDDAFQHWAQTAHTRSEAQVLAARIGLEIPQGNMREFQSSLMIPMRRLVSSADVHKQCRIYVLMSHPQNSAAGMMGGAMDEGSGRWTPRPPSVEEEEALSRHRDFNSMIEEQGL